MPALSPFQELPLHIAEVIIRYYIIPIPHTLFREWLVLYDISNSWRTLALQRFYKRAVIRASAEIGEDKLEFSDKPNHIETDFALLRCVKEVDVLFEYGNSGLGDSKLDDLSSSWPESLMFPSAHTLKICVTEFVTHYETIGETPITSEFMWLVQRIKTALPKLQKAEIDDNSLRVISNRLPHFLTLWNTDNLMAALFERVTTLKVCMRMSCPINIYPSVYENSRLVQLTFDCMYNEELLLHIVKDSSSTLETLILQNGSSQTMISLVVDNAKYPVVYPRLQKLDIESIYGHGSPVRAFKIGSSAAIFPALRYLKWHSPYMFEDDLLFRGNSDTLEYLDIAFSNKLADVLERHSVFSVGRYPRLSHIRVEKRRNNSHETLNIDTYLEHVDALISPATQLLSMWDMITYQKLNRAIFRCSSMQNVRVLELGLTSIAFIKMLELIKGLPNLEELMCSSKNAYPELKSVTSEIVKFVKSTHDAYHSLSYRFKIFIISTWDEGFEREIALVSITLAVLLPNFVYTKFSDEILEKYLPSLETATAEFSGSQYAETLERLYKRSVDYFSIPPLNI